MREKVKANLHYLQFLQSQLSLYMMQKVINLLVLRLLHFQILILPQQLSRKLKSEQLCMQLLKFLVKIRCHLAGTIFIWTQHYLKHVLKTLKLRQPITTLLLDQMLYIYSHLLVMLHRDFLWVLMKIVV